MKSVVLWRIKSANIIALGIPYEYQSGGGQSDKISDTREIYHNIIVRFIIYTKN